MSEAHRYRAINLITEDKKCINYYSGGPEVVLATSFDRVTAERDALQQLLTAADERADVLEGLLHRVYDADLAARHHQPYNVSKLIDEIEAALKPAEPATEEHICTGCGSKGWTANCAKCVPF